MSILKYFKLKTVELVLEDGTPFTKIALVYGNFAIHPHGTKLGYTFSALPSGRGFNGTFPTLEAAARAVALLNGIDAPWNNPSRDASASLHDLYGDRAGAIKRAAREFRVLQ